MFEFIQYLSVREPTAELSDQWLVACRVVPGLTISGRVR